ncbi:putative WD repeat-containing protein C3D6.12 [Erysiphe neolycopersici]|uniref:Putative WD repeat-containing protein C3D6.12 n=1 Tax=Erysiphe neolycopersici TaxID=212602 RepID=A0A420HCK4_9PEZI|nr:putative WD repeat-containing protein C3D6.12 [Erysiphe neolycopersici]
MVKSYLKYEQSNTFGVINSGTSNVVWCEDRAGASQVTKSGYAIVPANEEVFCWDIKKGELLSRWKDIDCKFQVTAISQSKADRDIFAVGYEDGSIRVWDSKTSTTIVKFNGHRSEITVLRFDCSGVRLASGSKDTDIILWDLIDEVGLFKFRGHKDQITGLEFFKPITNYEDYTGEDGQTLVVSEDDIGATERFLITTSKDALIKLWDIETRHCIETHVAQSNGECWSLGISLDGAGCITGGNDGELNIWSIDCKGLLQYTLRLETPPENHIIRSRGTLHCQGRSKIRYISFHPSQNYFAVHGNEKSVEIWRIRSEEEVKKSLARRRRRKREKKPATTGNELFDSSLDQDIPDETSEDLLSVNITELFMSYLVVRAGGRVRSIDWIKNRSSKTIQILVATTNNQLEVYNILTKDKSGKKTNEMPDYSRSLSVELPGHRADIRALSLSSDDRMLASTSNGDLKIWNIRTRNCIRTFDCGYALCCSFLPGDKILVVGTKTGDLELFDVVSAAMIERVQAHEGAIWALQVHPNGQSLISGSADKTAKFWKFNVIQEPILGSRRTTPRFSLSQDRILKVSDDILSLRFSPDARLIAIALLDSTVKVFFVDSLKIFLNLYGHKLPVLNMDISFDSKLIVTCSADKNIRLWGLDFGDCRKAFFAHQDSILQVAFVRNNHDGNGHNFFSSSKDKMIKYWDGDKFEHIQKLTNHHGEIWALAVSNSGKFLVSASHDKSIRLWEETDEQIFLEEEKEKELEELYESALATSLDKDLETDEAELGTVSKQTSGTLTAGERIAEALDISTADLEIVREWESAKISNPNIAPPSRNLIFMALGGISAEEHVLRVLQKVRAAELDDALLVLPFASVLALFKFLEIFAVRSMDIQLTCRILLFMLKTHHHQIIASKIIKASLQTIRTNLRRVLTQQKSEIGFNLAALKVISLKANEREVRDFIDDRPDEEKSGQRKRGFISVS